MSPSTPSPAASTAPGGGRPVTLRATSSMVSFVAAALVIAVLLVDSVLRAGFSSLVSWVGLAAFGLWVLWLLLVRTSIRLEPERLLVRNLVRVHAVPWSRVREVTQRQQVLVGLDDGRTITCAGGPFPARLGTAAAKEKPAAVQAIELWRDSAPGSDAPARRLWDVPALVAGLVCAVLAILGLWASGSGM